MNVLFPTDYSDHARIGLKYAIELCNSMDAQLHVVSAFSVQKTASSFISLRDIIKKNTEDEMDKLISSVTSLIKTDRIPETAVIEGNPVKVINDYSKRHEIDVIVMGTQGANSLKTILLGSVTRKVAQEATVPILAVPASVIPDQLKEGKFALAVDGREIEMSDGISSLVNIAKILGKQIDILHVTEDDEDDFPFDPFITNYLKDCFGEVVLLKGSDPVQRIKKYVENNNVSLLTMIKRKHTWLERLLVKGNTGQEILVTNIPLLIIPE